MIVCPVIAYIDEVMSDMVLLIALFSIGAVVLVAEIFLPSHGILTVVGIGFLITAVAKTFQLHGRDAGVIASLACLLAVPTGGYLAVKYWRQTAIGRMIAPPNPQLTSEDTSVPVDEIQSMIGRTGKCLSPLRPVGICVFNGHRISCVAQFGMIEAGATVEGVGMTGSNLAVAEKKV